MKTIEESVKFVTLKHDVDVYEGKDDCITAQAHHELEVFKEGGSHCFCYSSHLGLGFWMPKTLIESTREINKKVNII